MTGKLWMRVPESMKINWEGTLPARTMAKDVMLRTLRETGYPGRMPDEPRDDRPRLIR